MDNIRQYLLSIITAAILCGIINGIISKKGAYGSIVKLLTGLVLAVMVISPLAKIELSDLTVYGENISLEADNLVSGGNEMAREASASIIKSQTEAYILDKASAMELDIAVDVTLDDEDPPIPASVSITGAVSPYAKRVLSSLIENDLGISEENQLWT